MSVIIGAIFVGFYTTNVHNKAELSSLLLFVGMVFSLGWIMINKGSRFWQENWEAHIDYLEDEIEGKLYKIVNESDLHSDAYSISRVNLYLSKFVFFVFAFIFVYKILNILFEKSFKNLFDSLLNSYGYIIFLIIGLIMLWIVFWMLAGAIWKSLSYNNKKTLKAFLTLQWLLFIFKTRPQSEHNAKKTVWEKEI